MKNTKSLLSLLFLILLITVTFLWFFHQYDFRETMQAMKNASLAFLFAAVLSNLMFVLCEAYNLYAILVSIQADVKFRKCVKYVFVECYFCAITPSASGGQPAQLLYMRDDGIPLGKSSVALLIIAITYKGSLLLYAGITYLMTRISFLDTMGRLRYLFYLGILMNAGAVLFMVMALFSGGIIRRLSFFLIAALKQIPGIRKIRIMQNTERLYERVNRTMDSYQEGAVYIAKHKDVFVRVLAITMVQRTFRFIVTYFVYCSFGLHETGMLPVLLLQSVVSVSADMIPIPGAVGVSETCYMRLFRSVFPREYLMPSLVLSRGISFYGMVFLSSIMIIVSQIRKIGREKRGNM
mgnify:FL=1